MLLAITQGIIIYTVNLFAFSNHCMITVDGKSVDHWMFSITTFTSLLFVVTNKLLITTKLFEPVLVVITTGTILFYICYLMLTDDYPGYFMQHFTFWRLFSSMNFYAIALFPILVCAFMDIVFETRPLIFFSDPQSYLRHYLKEPKRSKDSIDPEFV